MFEIHGQIENTTIYLEQTSAAFIALPEVSYHSRALSGKSYLFLDIALICEYDFRNETFAISCI